MVSVPPTVVDGHGFGRIASADARDGLYPMRAILGAPIEGRTGVKVWEYDYDSLNQGNEGTCVGHGWKHFLVTKPLTQAGPTESPLARDIYMRATEIDEFPGSGDPNSGTSVRAGAETLRELGLLGSYVHAQSLVDVTEWLASQGSVVIGVNWYEGMMQGTPDGLLHATGRIVGGHCVCVQGVDFDNQKVLIRNSWGKTWGPWGNGMANLNFTDFERLLFREGGDCIAGLEVPIAPTPPFPPVLTFADAEKAAIDQYNSMPTGARYSSMYYRKIGSGLTVQAIAKRKAQG